MKSPAIRVAVDAGKTYYWCGCGLSSKQPFCDGRHKDDAKGRNPIKYTAVSNRIVSFCTCKKTDLPPICDGSHKKIEKDEAVNEEDVLKLTELASEKK